jgi:P-loop containing dynein motor region
MIWAKFSPKTIRRSFQSLITVLTCPMAAGPALGRRCVLFIDDVASCQPVHGYIRSPLELRRHWLNYESMFECQTASKIEFIDMVGLHWGIVTQ